METYENHVWPRQLPSDVDLFLFLVDCLFLKVSLLIIFFFIINGDTFIYHSAFIGPSHNLNLEILSFIN